MKGQLLQIQIVRAYSIMTKQEDKATQIPRKFDTAGLYGKTK